MKRMTAYVEDREGEGLLVYTKARDLSHLQDRMKRHLRNDQRLKAVFTDEPFSYPTLLWARHPARDRLYWSQFWALDRQRMSLREARRYRSYHPTPMPASWLMVCGLFCAAVIPAVLAFFSMPSG